MITTIETDEGNIAVRIEKFAALDGWDIQRRFIEFAESPDKDFRRAFTLEVLSYAVVIKGDQEIPLSTDALIDNHLEKWENVQALFEKILLANGIDPKSHASRPEYWERVGNQIGVAFVEYCVKTLSPAFDIAAKE